MKEKAREPGEGRREEPRVDEEVRARVGLACSYCRDRLEPAGAVYCAACLSPSHEECSRDHGGCSAPGCGERRVVRSATLEGDRRTRGALRPVLALVVGGVAVVLATGLALFASPSALDSGLAREVGVEPGPVEPGSVEPAPPRASVQLTTRGDWSLRGDVEEVAREVARAAGATVEVDPALRGGRVDLELTDRTWREALEAVAWAAGGGLEEREDGLALTPHADPAPFRLVPREPLPPPDPLAAPAEEVDFGAGLDWLRTRQHTDGSWRVDGRPSLGATSLAVLSFLGNGHTHRFGAYEATVQRALGWLKSARAVPGSGAPAPHLERALRAMALAEAYAVSRDFTLKRHVERVVAELVELQGEDGAWGFAAERPGDTLATVHAVLACKAATTAGIDVGPEVLARADGFLARATATSGETGFRHPDYGRSLTLGDPDEAPPVPLLTAGVPLARIFCGAGREDEEIVAGWRLLQRAPPRPDRVAPAYTYLASYSAFQMGGEAWRAWSRDLEHALGHLQRRSDDGEEAAGSWDPAGLWGELFGRPGTTATHLLALEVYYRWERTQVDEPR